MKEPYFTTADGVAVYDRWQEVFSIGFNLSGYFVVPESCNYAVSMYDSHRIFSTRAAAQAECEKLNKV